MIYNYKDLIKELTVSRYTMCSPCIGTLKLDITMLSKLSSYRFYLLF